MSDNEPGTRAWRFFAVVFLAIGTLGFGLAGLCGAAFTAMALPDLFVVGAKGYAYLMLAISTPSLLIGGGLAWICGRGLYRHFRRRNA